MLIITKSKEFKSKTMANKKKATQVTPKRDLNCAKNPKSKLRRKAIRTRKRATAKRAIGVIVLARTDIVRSPTPASMHDFGDPQTP
ncbi:unnamed protein product [Chironomus riparius]|uniref:Uncharacterized protein n=1 Tax=Chironomus riparius TaxID=315576 RepID=A0A9P0NNL5_9DIPT|nr:unnamed protein product [Chironomus riparius]